MKLLCKLLIAASMFIAVSADAQSQVTFTENEATVVIDGNTTRLDLADLRTTLGERSIDFRYSFQFNNDTRLESINFQVSANNGAITCEGIHNSLQSNGAKVTFRINKANGTCTVDIVE